MILQRLRAETRPQHELLDHHPLMVQLMGPGLTRSHYENILLKFLGFYEPFEAALLPYQHWSSLGLDLHARRKTPRLLQDLRALDVATADVPQAGPAVWIHDEASALGAFYVMEGSTLGGQVISQHVAARLGLSPQTGLAFFSSYGADVGARWRETREALVQFAARSSAEDAMVEAAKKTFMALAHWLGPVSA